MPECIDAGCSLKDSPHTTYAHAITGYKGTTTPRPSTSPAEYAFIALIVLVVIFAAVR